MHRRTYYPSARHTIYHHQNTQKIEKKRKEIKKNNKVTH